MRVLARHGLSGLVSEAKRAGGDAFAARTAERLLAMICDAAVRELGCTRARELIIDEVTPSDLPEGSYELTFGDRNEKSPGGISKQGEAHHRGGTWTVEDVRDA